MNRRTFIKSAAASFAALMTGCGLEKNFLNIKFLRQIITKNISNSRLIMWQIDEPLKNPYVEVKINGGTKIFPVNDSSFTDDGKKNIQYTAQIDFGDEFRIVDGDAATFWHTLKNFSGNKFKAIIFSDSQCGGSYDTWGQIARHAFENHSDANFFVDIGDLVDNGEDSAQWEDCQQ